MDEAPNQPERARGLLLVAVVFVLGAVCGVALYYLGQRSMLPPRFGGFGADGPHPGAGLERLTRELNLDAEQKKKIEAILTARRARMQKFLEEGRSEIRDVLRPDQQKLFDALPHDHPGRHGWRSGPPQEPPSDQPPGAPPGPPPGGPPPSEPPPRQAPD